MLNYQKALESSNPKRTAEVEAEIEVVKATIKGFEENYDSADRGEKSRMTRQTTKLNEDLAGLNAMLPPMLVNEEVAVRTAIEEIQLQRNKFFEAKSEFMTEFAKDPINALEWLSDSIAKADVSRKVAQYFTEWLDRYNEGADVPPLTIDSLEAVIEECKKNVLQRIVKEGIGTSVGTDMFRNVIRSAQAEKAYSLIQPQAFWDEWEQVNWAINHWRKHKSVGWDLA